MAFLISADLFACGIATLIQSLGATQWLGIKLPVMMGVTFAAVGPMDAIGNQNQGIDGARMTFGAIIGAGMVSFGKVATEGWFAFIKPFAFGMLIFEPVLIVTMSLPMIVAMIESTGMFLALDDMTGKRVTQPMLSSGLRADDH